MAIERWDPFGEAISLRDAMNSLFLESFVRPSTLMTSDGGMTMPLDISESDNEFVVKASLPGVKPEDLKVTIRGDTLSIAGETSAEEEKGGERWHVRERRFGAFQRSVVLGEPVDAAKAESSCEHGVLTLRLPKSQAAKPQQIKIGGASKS